MAGLHKLGFNSNNALFRRLKEHNLELLNQIKKDKDLDGITKKLEKENNRFISDNQNLKENNISR